jgi:hypothetical protein
MDRRYSGMIGTTRIGTALVALAAAALVLTLGGSDVARAQLALEAAEATITVDGDDSDWASIDGLDVTLAQPDYAGTEFDAPNAVEDRAAVVKVATDADNIYVLFEITDDYDFNGPVPPNDHKLSASPNVMFLIDPAAGAHMGAGDDDFETGLGMVDIWHWEMDCDYDVTSGGGDAGSGDDPDCNLDDEFSTDPEAREDDGGGDTANPNAENSLAGMWEHTGRADGAGAAGTWIFEMSRPLQTGDPEDAQFASGGTASMALAYFDADEGAEGWTDTGHLTSADEGWITVTLPGAAAPDEVPTTGGAPSADGGGSTMILVLLALGSLATLTGAVAVFWRLRTSKV